MAQEINLLLDKIIDKFKLAMDLLFDVVEEVELSKLSHINRIKLDKIQKARDIYHEFFPC